MKIGYARVSTRDQSLDLQLDALQQAGCEKVYQETVSGAKEDRPELKSLMDNLRKGDVIVIWKLDRLGRSLKHLVEIGNQLLEQVKHWIAKEKELLQPVEEAIQQADSLVRAFNARIAEQQRQMLERIAREEAAQLRETEKAESPVEVEQVRQAHDFQRQLAQARHQTDGVRLVWSFELEDLSQVPREYLVLDEKKVRQAIRSGKRNIPGLRIFQQQQTVYR